MKLLPNKEATPSITEDELLILVEEAAQEGSIDEDDELLIKSVVAFNDLEVQKIFVPRTDIISINSKKSTEEIAEIFESSGLSRLPYCQDSIDDVKGVINQKDFYYHVRKGEKKLEEIVKPISFVPKSMKISELMKKFQADQIHIAIIIDEYGGTAGLVTLEDIIEELVGEIWDEYDSKELDYYKLADGSFLVNGRSDFDCLEELFNISNTTNSATVAGYILSSIERIPIQGETIQLDGLKMTISKMRNRRIEEVVVEPVVEGE